MYTTKPYIDYILYSHIHTGYTVDYTCAVMESRNCKGIETGPFVPHFLADHYAYLY